MSHKRFPFAVVLFISWAALLGACQTGSKGPESSIQQASWDSRLKLKDLVKNKSQSVSVDVLGRRSTGEIRLEMSAILGIPVASVVMNPKNFAAALYREKKFYQGAISERALQPLIRVALSPVVLRQIIFDEPIRGGDWSCERGVGGFVASCRSSSRSLEVTWERQGLEKTARVRHPNFEIDWVFEAPSTEVQFKSETFVLEPPKGFRLIRL